MNATVKVVEQLGALVLCVPLSKVVAYRKNPFLCPRFLLIATRSAHTGIQFVFFDRAEQGSGLQHVAAGVLARFFHNAARIDVVLNVANDEFDAGLFYKPVAKFNRFRKVVPGINMYQGKGNLPGIEGFLCDPYKRDGVFASGKKYGGTLKLSRRFANDIDRLVLEIFRKNFQILTHPDLSLFSWFCFVKSAFFLRLFPPPSTGPDVFTRLYRTCAGRATNAGESFRVQRVHRDLVSRDEGLHFVIRPV